MIETIIMIGIVLLAIFLAGRHFIRLMRGETGGCGCGTGCSSCTSLCASDEKDPSRKSTSSEKSLNQTEPDSENSHSK